MKPCHKSPCSKRVGTGAGTYAVCLPCGIVEPLNVPTEAASSPQKDTETGGKAKQGIRRRGNPEAVLVQQIVQVLELYGYTVLRLNQWRGDKAGSTAGSPDIMCYCPKRQGWIGIEIKTSSGRLSPAQARLAEGGMVDVARSVEDALRIVRGETGK